MIQNKGGKEMLKVILDVDDVLNDCNQIAVERLNREKRTRFHLEDITKWGLLHNDLDLRLNYFESPDFMKNLPAKKGAHDFVKELSKISEVFVATAIHKNCAGIRIDQIFHDFPEVEPGNIIIGERKNILLADVLLDDAYHNIASSNVKYPVLFDRPWNRHVTGIPRVSDYKEFLGLIQLLSKPSLEKEVNLIVLVGPSASGKSSLADLLLKTKGDSLEKVESFTTRSPRFKGERYHFVSKKEFLALQKKGYFLETTIYKGQYYGTAWEDMQPSKKKKLLVVDINGALRIKEKYPENTLLIYVDREKERLIESILQRNLATKETIERIISIDQEEKNKNFCDFIVDNNRSLQEAADDIWDCIYKTHFPSKDILKKSDMSK